MSQRHFSRAMSFHHKPKASTVHLMSKPKLDRSMSQRFSRAMTFHHKPKASSNPLQIAVQEENQIMVEQLIDSKYVCIASAQMAQFSCPRSFSNGTLRLPWSSIMARVSVKPQNLTQILPSLVHQLIRQLTPSLPHSVSPFLHRTSNLLKLCLGCLLTSK